MMFCWGLWRFWRNIEMCTRVSDWLRATSQPNKESKKHFKCKSLKFWKGEKKFSIACLLYKRLSRKASLLHHNYCFDEADEANCKWSKVLCQAIHPSVVSSTSQGPVWTFRGLVTLLKGTLAAQLSNFGQQVSTLLSALTFCCRSPVVCFCFGLSWTTTQLNHWNERRNLE